MARPTAILAWTARAVGALWPYGLAWNHQEIVPWARGMGVNVPLWNGVTWFWCATSVMLLIVLIQVGVAYGVFALRMRPAIKVEFVDQPPCLDSWSSESGGQMVRIIRLHVTNVAGYPLDNCFVRLHRLVYPDGTFGAHENIAMITQEQLRLRVLGGRFELGKGEGQYVEIARFNESDPTSEIQLQYDSIARPIPDFGYTVPSGKGPYTLLMKATGGEARGIRLAYSLFVDTSGMLRMLKLDDSAWQAVST